MPNYQLEELKKEIDVNILNLNTLANSSSSITTQNSYNDLKTKYDELVAQNETDITKYNSILDQMKTTQTVRLAQTYVYDIPNSKDENQWRAGGYLRNQAGPGGAFYSPTSSTSFNEKPNGDFGQKMQSGNLLSDLNMSYTQVHSLVEGFGFLDLMRSYTKRETKVYNVSISIDETILIDTEISVSHDGNEKDFNISTPKGDMNMQDVYDAYNFDDDALPLIDVASLYGIDTLTSNILISLIDVATGDELKAFQRIANFTMTTIKNGFKNQIIQTVINSLGVTSIGTALSIGAIIHVVFGELFEMIMGLDNNFGFGGEFKAADQNGKAVFGRAKSLTQGLSEMLPDFAREAIGLDYEDLISKLEDNGAYGLTSAAGKTSLYSYNSFSGDNINLTASLEISNSPGFNDLGKLDALNLSASSLDPFESFSMPTSYHDDDDDDDDDNTTTNSSESDTEGGDFGFA